MSREEIEPGATTGMGVLFLDLKPLEAAVIGSLVDRLDTEASAPTSSQSSPPSS
jgi:hypothetical protein